MPDVAFSSPTDKPVGKQNNVAGQTGQAGQSPAASVLHPAAAKSAAATLPLSMAQQEMHARQDRWVVRLTLNLALVLASVGLVVGTFWWGQSLKAEQESQQNALQQKQSALVRLEQQISLEKSKQDARLGRLATMVQEIHKRSLPWTKIISAVEAVLPKEAQVFAYSGRYLYDDRNQVGRNIISIQGTVDTYSRIADLIDTLEKTELFSGVQFDGSSKSVSEDGSETVQLKISFDLNPADRTTDELVAVTSPNVVAFGEEGSDSVSVAPLDLPSPLPPVGLAAKSIPARPNEGKIQLTWQSAAAGAHSAADIGGTNESGASLLVASYVVQINKVGETAVETKEVVVTNPSYPTYSFTYVTDQPKQKYEFRVMAKDTAGQLSKPSDAVAVEVADDKAPTQPQFVVSQTTRALASGESSQEELKLVWQAGDASEDDLYRYYLYTGSDPDDLRLLATTDAKTTNYSYVDKISDKALYFRVVAEDTSGNTSVPQIKPLKLAVPKN